MKFQWKVDDWNIFHYEYINTHRSVKCDAPPWPSRVTLKTFSDVRSISSNSPSPISTLFPLLHCLSRVNESTMELWHIKSTLNSHNLIFSFHFPAGRRREEGEKHPQDVARFFQLLLGSVSVVCMMCLSVKSTKVHFNGEMKFIYDNWVSAANTRVRDNVNWVF